MHQIESSNKINNKNKNNNNSNHKQHSPEQPSTSCFHLICSNSIDINKSISKRLLHEYYPFALEMESIWVCKFNQTKCLRKKIQQQQFDSHFFDLYKTSKMMIQLISKKNLYKIEQIALNHQKLFFLSQNISFFSSFSK